MGIRDGVQVTFSDSFVYRALFFTKNVPGNYLYNFKNKNQCKLLRRNKTRVIWASSKYRYHPRGLMSQELGEGEREIFLYLLLLNCLKSSPVAQTVKNLPVVQETWVQSWSWEEPLEKENATHSSILAWRIPWTEGLSGLQSMGSQRVGHD